MKKPAIGAAIAGIIIAATAVASASIPGPDGTIHACYRADGPAQGNLVVIDSDESCPTGFTALDWNTGGLPGYEIVVEEDVLQSGPAPVIRVDCPTGKSVVGGGVSWNGLGVYPSGDVGVISSYPDMDGSGWIIIYRGYLNSTIDLYAVCVDA